MVPRPLQLAPLGLVATSQAVGAEIARELHALAALDRRYVIGGTIVFAAQLALIVALLVQRARRRRAEQQAATNARAEEALRQAEVRYSAMLRAIPDLMFVLRRDGTYIDYHASDPRSLFVPPDAFLGRTVRDTLPPALAEMMMTALERAARTGEEVIVEYDLTMTERRFFEARIVTLGSDRLLSIVRDVTEWKRAAQLNRELARRVIASQETERQRIARELHDDVSQRMALANIDIDEIGGLVDSEQVRSRLRALSAHVVEIATDLHNLSYELHPSKLRALGLVPAVEALCRDVSKQHALDATFTHGPMPQIDADVSLCIYRIVQEALRNAARHSHARDAQVSLACEDDHIVLQVVDGGDGFNPADLPASGLGLLSMRERAAALQGQVTIDAATGRGTRIDVRIPLSASADPLA